MRKTNKLKPSNFKFPKAPTGIEGLDIITTGGVPKNRPTLLLGNTGCGKTIMAMEFLVNGITMFDEPAVFMAFEEKTDELVVNVNSLGYDLTTHLKNNKIYLEHVQVDISQIVETGKYDLEGLFVRLEYAINKVKAKRVVLDSLDTLFYGFDVRMLRSEFKRLFSWLKEKKVTAIITAETGEAFLSRHGLVEYVADCVMILDNRVKDQISIRRLRIVKYRGSVHGINEYPFIIDEKGITVLPLVGEGTDQKHTTKRISTGIEQLDEMLEGKGFFQRSSILVSGTAGTGKTSIAASFAYNICKKDKEKCLFCVLEEAPNQVMRNMKSVGILLEPLVESGKLQFYYSRPTVQNLELHFISIKKIIKEFQPSVIILDPITNLMTEGPNSDVRMMLTQFVECLKTEQITVMFTAAITVGSIKQNPSDEGISSMVDTWIMLKEQEAETERSRTLSVMKARGIANSNKLMHFNITSKGIELKEPDKNKKFKNLKGKVKEEDKEEEEEQ